VSEQQTLLWAIRKDGENGSWFGGADPDYWETFVGVLTWDAETFPEGELLAYELGEEYEIVPYLTLEQVLEAFIKAKNQALRGSTPAARMMVDGLFKALGLG